MQFRSRQLVRAITLALCTSSCGASPGSDLAQTTDTLSLFRVGPGQAYSSLQQVAPLLNPGDVIEVYGDAVYPGDIRLTRHGTASNPITIRGVRVNGRRPVLSGGYNTIELAGNYHVFEGFEVTAATMRCVFHHAHAITIRDSVIHDCPSHGILGADADSGSLTLEYSEVYRTGASDRRHQIYMATDERAFPGAVFRMQHCYVHDGLGGNNVKSRAERNEIYYNWIEGAYYHELELIGPDGQSESLAREDSDIVGNVLYQGYTTRSHYPIRVGGDGTGQTWGRYRFVNNTIVLGNATTSAAFRLFDGMESIEMHNNVLVRLGGTAVVVLRDLETRWKSGRVIAGSNNWVPAGSSALPSTWTGTRFGADPGFVNVASRDVHLQASSPLLNVGNSAPASAAGYAFPRPLMPPGYEPPGRALLSVGSAVTRLQAGTIDIGAYEYGPTAPPPESSTFLTPRADSYARGGTYASTNFGSQTTLQVKTHADPYWSRDAYLEFDVSAVSAVTSARLRLYARLSDPGSVPSAVHALSDTTWSESALTWNSRPGFGSPTLGSFTVSGTSYAWYEVDITAYLQAQRAQGRTRVSFALHNPSYSTPRIDIASREATGNRPSLVVN